MSVSVYAKNAVFFSRIESCTKGIPFIAPGAIKPPKINAFSSRSGVKNKKEVFPQ